MHKPSLIILFILITISFYGCATMQGQWEEAVKEDTITAYSRFLRNADPDAEYKHKAETRIKELEVAKREKEERYAFESAKLTKPKYPSDERPIRALEFFLSRYPSGKHALEARKLLEKREYERLIKINEWKRTNKWIDYEEFIAKYPNSDLVPDASARARKLRYEYTRKSETASDYENFIKRYPEGQDTIELKNDLPRIRKLEQARDVEKGKFEQAKKLGEVALRMAPVITAPTKRNPDGTITQSIGLSRLASPSDLKHQLALFRKLLEQGADPSLIRIDGFRPHYLYGSGAVSFGWPGKVVSAKQNGISLMEYFNIIQLKEGKDLLKKFSGKQGMPPAGK